MLQCSFLVFCEVFGISSASACTESYCCPVLQVFAATGSKVEYKVGTMIEVPRGALRAGDLAKTAEFFSFGTNDLTQMTFGISRDDAQVG